MIVLVRHADQSLTQPLISLSLSLLPKFICSAGEIGTICHNGSPTFVFLD
jgi:hypothetical protein